MESVRCLSSFRVVRRAVHEMGWGRGVLYHCIISC